MIIENIIRKLKSDPQYLWESSYSGRDLFIIAGIRLNQILRGLFLKPFLKRSAGLLFVGRNVKVRYGHLISAGKNLILEDNVSISALSENGIILGDHVSLARGSIFFCTGVIAQKGTGITIGDRTGISANAYFAGQGGIIIGNDVIMGPDVQIFSENHNYNDLQTIIKNQGVTRQPVIIGNNCWIGGRVTILAGVTIGDGCVVAAGSVVTRSILPDTIAAGVPARVIKQRGEV